MLKIVLKDWSTLHQFLGIYIILEAVTGHIDFCNEVHSVLRQAGQSKSFR